MIVRRLAAVGAALLAAGCARPNVEEAPSLFGTASDEVERFYPEPVDDVWDALAESLRSNQFVAARQDRDKLGGDLVAQRIGGRVYIRVRKLADQQTLASIRAEPQDRVLATRLHESAAHALGWGEAKEGLFGGASATASGPPLPVERALPVVRNVFRSLRIEELGKGESSLRGRSPDSTPVHVRFGEEGEVTFVAGVSRSGATRALADRMKREYEHRARQLAP